MKMKFIAAMIAGTALLATGTAYAADTFVGPSFALGLSAGSATSEVTSSRIARQVATQHGLRMNSGGFSQEGSVKPILDASYGIPLTDRWIVTLGANYIHGTIKAGSALLIGTPELSSYLKLKNHMSLYAAPGMRIGEQWLIYGKLGYHQATAEFGESHTRLPASSSTVKGFGIGFGGNYALARNVDLRMELEYVKFNSYTRKDPTGVASFYTGKPDVRRANVLLGYRF